MRCRRCLVEEGNILNGYQVQVAALIDRVRTGAALVCGFSLNKWEIDGKFELTDNANMCMTVTYARHLKVQK